MGGWNDDPDDFPDGRPLLNLINSGSNTFTVRDESNNTITTVAAGATAMLAVVKINVSGDHKWYAV